MRGTGAAIALLALGCIAAPLAARERVEPVTVGIIAFNDFHGNLEPPPQLLAMPDGKGTSIAVPAGGIVALATAFEKLREKYRYHATVSAGDLIGASPLVSSLFLDEPTITMMNLLELDFNAVGNHEFDRGREELLRMQRGGCEQYTMRVPCQVEGFGGAGFTFLSASTFTEDGSTLFPATGIKTYGKGRSKVSVGFIGLTLRDTPSLVSSEGIEGLTFGDEAEAINAAVARLKSGGADAVVVLIHQGGEPLSELDPNGCDGLGGAILPILARLDRRVDAVVSGHTHRAYVCDPGEAGEAYPFLLTSAGSLGRIVTDIALTIDPAKGKVIAREARNAVVQSPALPITEGTHENAEGEPAPEEQPVVTHFLRPYQEAAKDLAMRPVGRLSGPATRTQGARSPMGGALGNLIADAQLAATRDAGARVALTNPFGIRAPLEPSSDGTVLFSQIYAAQPFGNLLVTQTLTGAEIKAVLEQGLGQDRVQLLTPSQGFTYVFDMARPAGDRITRMELDGNPLEPGWDYRVTTNSFLAGGGDGFTILAGKRDAVRGITDLDALEAWLKAADVREVPPDDRVMGSPL